MTDRNTKLSANQRTVLEALAAGRSPFVVPSRTNLILASLKKRGMVCFEGRIWQLTTLGRSAL